MRPLIYALCTVFLGGSSLMAQHEPEPFTEKEMYTALSWGMSEQEAKKLAKYMSDDPAVMATIPEFYDGSPGFHNYSDSTLLLLSLVSDETNRKVEERLIDRRSGTPLTPEERADWDRRRSILREQLIKAGKLRR